MRKYLAALMALAGVSVAVIELSCGSSPTRQVQQQTVPTGSLTILGSDAPLCAVLSLNVTITGATLTPEGGGSPVSVISSSQPLTVDFASLMDFATVLSFSQVAAGDYPQITLTLSNPQLMALDTTQSPPAPASIPATLTKSTVTVNIEPDLDVETDGSASLTLDFNLLKSVQTDANGQVTGTISPVFRAKAKKSTGDAHDELDDLKGTVQSVTTTSSNSAFIGSFVLAGGQKPLTINITSDTKFDDISGLSALAPNTFVEVNARLDSNGNIVAKQVSAEDADDQNPGRVTLVGLTTSVDRDSSGHATQFKMFVAETHPEDNSLFPEHAPATVNLTGTTVFNIANPVLNQASLTFDATTLGVGQAVTVHGDAAQGSPGTLTATSVFLRTRSIVGNFSALLAAGSDDFTGGFTMVPCSPIFQAQPTTVLTSSQTEFRGVSGLKELSPTPLVVVKGLVFYQQTSGAANGASWNAPAFVDEAQRVHQRTIDHDD